MELIHNFGVGESGRAADVFALHSGLRYLFGESPYHSCFSAQGLELLGVILADPLIAKPPQVVLLFPTSGLGIISPLDLDRNGDGLAGLQFIDAQRKKLPIGNGTSGFFRSVPFRKNILVFFPTGRASGCWPVNHRAVRLDRLPATEKKNTNAE